MCSNDDDEKGDGTGMKLMLVFPLASSCCSRSNAVRHEKDKCAKRPARMYPRKG
jgi:hypothetical protein